MEDHQHERPGLSEFGAPLRHDGCLYPMTPFFVPALADIEKEGWDYIHQSTGLHWAIIPHKTRKEYDAANEVNPLTATVGPQA